MGTHHLKEREPLFKPTFEELSKELALEQELNQQLRVKNFHLLQEIEDLKKRIGS